MSPNRRLGRDQHVNPIRLTVHGVYPALELEPDTVDDRLRGEGERRSERADQTLAGNVQGAARTGPEVRFMAVEGVDSDGLRGRVAVAHGVLGDAR